MTRVILVFLFFYLEDIEIDVFCRIIDSIELVNLICGMNLILVILFIWLIFILLHRQVVHYVKVYLA